MTATYFHATRSTHVKRILAHGLLTRFSGRNFNRSELFEKSENQPLVFLAHDYEEAFEFLSCIDNNRRLAILEVTLPDDLPLKEGVEIDGPKCDGLTSAQDIPPSFIKLIWTGRWNWRSERYEEIGTIEEHHPMSATAPDVNVLSKSTTVEVKVPA
jgi:hypothetical protein